MKDTHYLYNDALRVIKVHCFETEISTTGIPFLMYNFHCCLILMLRQIWFISLFSGEKSVLLKRACLLMCHEICHMFGLQHCIYFHCLMNGSNHFEENDKKPLRLCPVCLRKLHSSCGFKIIHRYAKLAEFCHLAGMKSESEWFEKRLHQLSWTMSSTEKLEFAGVLFLWFPELFPLYDVYRIGVWVACILSDSLKTQTFLSLSLNYWLFGSVLNDDCESAWTNCTCMQ